MVLPDDPSPMDTARAAFLGHRAGPASAIDQDTGRRLGLTPAVTEVGAALIELGCWRTHIADLPPGPELVAALSRRPDQLAPAPLTDPDAALHTAVTAPAPPGWATGSPPGGPTPCWNPSPPATGCCPGCRPSNTPTWPCCPGNYPGLHEMLPTEIAYALRCSEAAAGNAISTARTITTRLPDTHHALHQGLIDADHAIAIARATGTTTAEVAAQVETDLLPELTSPGNSTTAEQLRRRAARRVIIRDPDGAAERHATAAKDRHITRWAEDDGMAGLKVIAPAQQIAAIWEASTAMADANKTPADTRPLGARRVDALTDICNHILGGTLAIIPTGGDDGTRGTGNNPATNNPATNDPNTNDSDGDSTSNAADVAIENTPAKALSTPSPTATKRPTATKSPAATAAMAPHPTMPTTKTSATTPPTTKTSTTMPPTTKTSTTMPHDDWPSTTRPHRRSAPTTTPRRQRCGRQRRHQRQSGCRGHHHRATPAPGPPAPGPPPPATPPGRGRCYRSRSAPATAANPTSRSSSPTPSCSAPTTPANSSATAPSPPTKPASSSPTAPCNDSSATPSPASSWTTAAPATNHPTPSNTSSSPETAPAAHPAATNPPTDAKSTTSSPTDPQNPPAATPTTSTLDLKCQHHHRAKDGGGFSNTRDPDGTSHWTTPLGRTYTRPPHSVWHTDQPESGTDATDQDETDWADRFPTQPTTSTTPESGTTRRSTEHNGR